MNRKSFVGERESSLLERQWKKPLFSPLSPLHYELQILSLSYSRALKRLWRNFPLFWIYYATLVLETEGTSAKKRQKRQKKERYEGFLLFFLFAIYFYFCFLEQLHVRTIGKLQGWWIEAPFLAFYPVTNSVAAPLFIPLFCHFASSATKKVFNLFSRLDCCVQIKFRGNSCVSFALHVFALISISLSWRPSPKVQCSSKPFFF